MRPKPTWQHEFILFVAHIFLANCCVYMALNLAMAISHKVAVYFHISCLDGSTHVSEEKVALMMDVEQYGTVSEMKAHV
jgi:Na+/melibiose symporter-like transporter